MTDAALSPTPPKPVVISIHGIRTRGEWQKRLQSSLDYHGFSTHVPLDYGYFNAVQFASSGAREKRLKWFLGEYDRIRKEYPGRPLHVVAHSFGTYLVARALAEYPNVVFERVIFCGSIVHPEYDWQTIAERRQVGGVLNDYAERDLWGRVAGWVAKDCGSSGSAGFTTRIGVVRQRCNPTWKHSHFFESVNFLTWTRFLRGEDDDLIVFRSPGNWRPLALWGLVGIVGIYAAGKVAQLGYDAFARLRLDAACTQGSGDACYSLGKQHKGRHTAWKPPFPSRPREYFAQACRLGNADGCFELTVLPHDDRKDPDLRSESERWRRKGMAILEANCSARVGRACAALAFQYDAGGRSERDIAYFRRRACDLGGLSPDTCTHHVSLLAGRCRELKQADHEGLCAAAAIMSGSAMRQSRAMLFGMPARVAVPRDSIFGFSTIPVFGMHGVVRRARVHLALSTQNGSLCDSFVRLLHPDGTTIQLFGPSGIGWQVLPGCEDWEEIPGCVKSIPSPAKIDLHLPDACVPTQESLERLYDRSAGGLWALQMTNEGSRKPLPTVIIDEAALELEVEEQF